METIRAMFLQGWLCSPGREGTRRAIHGNWTQLVTWGFPYTAARIDTACTEFGYSRFLPASDELRDSEPIVSFTLVPATVHGSATDVSDPP